MPTLILAVLGLLLGSLFLQADPLPIGSPAPVITALDQKGDAIHFADVYAKGITLVYFYPKAGTPGCTAQACSIRDAYSDLRAKGLQVLGVSRDTVEAQSKFQQDNHLPFTLIADPKGKVAEAFGVPKMLGVLPVDARQSFLVKDGKIVWYSPHAATKGSAEEVQKALAGLNG